MKMEACKILIVDDVVDNVKVAMGHLADLGCRRWRGRWSTSRT